MMVTKRVFKISNKNVLRMFRSKIWRFSGNNTACEALYCDASKLNLHRFQNKQINSDSVLRFRIQHRFISHPKNLGLFNLAQSVFLLFSHLRLARVYKRVTDLCKLEQKRLLSGYLSALTRSPRRRPSRDEILPTLSVASLFVERWGWRRGRRRRRRRIGRRNRPTSS